MAGLLYVKGCKSTAPISQQPAPVLKENEVAKIVIQPRNHKVTVTTKKGTTTHNLSDNTNEITLDKDGGVRVKNNPLGFELRPFLGTGLTDRVRIIYGADLFYFQKFNLGLGLASDITFHDHRVFTHVNYNVYSSICLGMMFDNHKTAGLDVTVRF